MTTPTVHDYTADTELDAADADTDNAAFADRINRENSVGLDLTNLSATAGFLNSQKAEPRAIYSLKGGLHFLAAAGTNATDTDWRRGRVVQCYLVPAPSRVVGMHVSGVGALLALSGVAGEAKVKVFAGVDPSDINKLLEFKLDRAPAPLMEVAFHGSEMKKPSDRGMIVPLSGASRNLAKGTTLAVHLSTVGGFDVDSYLSWEIKLEALHQR